MHLEQVIRRLASLARQGLVYRVAPGAALDVLQEAEARLHVKFPDQVAAFWHAFDGLEVDAPPFKIFSVREITRERDLLTFAVSDRTARIAFDVSAINKAGQWSILNSATGYCITLTMASFWSVHMWSWIAKRRPFWYDVHSHPVATMSSLKYEEPQPISHKEIEAALRSQEDQVTASALIKMGLHEQDWQWAERVCLTALSDTRKQVRIASLNALGHLARLHHRLHLEAVIPAVRKLLDDPDCQGVAEDALEDITMFVPEAGSQVI